MGVSGLAALGGASTAAAFLAWPTAQNETPKTNAKAGELGPTPPEPPPMVESRVARYVPDLSRTHSQHLYAQIVRDSAPLEAVVRKAELAITNAKMTAVELDLFVDDYVTRGAKMVVMGTIPGWTVAFAYRYLVDIEYPSNNVNGDGFGSAEWGKRTLSVFGTTFELRKNRSGETPRAIPGTVWWEPVDTEDKHDAAILYFPESSSVVRSAPSLEIPDAPNHIRQTLANSSTIFGLDYVLISPQSFKLLRDNVHSTSLKLEIFLAGLALGALFFLPLLGSATAGGLLSEATLGHAGKALVAQALPVAFDIGKKVVLRDDGIAAQVLGEDMRALLMGVEFPSDDIDGIGMLEKFLTAALADQSASFVGFSGSSRPGAGQVFLPEREMNLNLELIMRGLAKLDTRDLETARAFPQLVSAALDALDGKQELAAGWAQDEDYVADVRRLQSLLTG